MMIMITPEDFRRLSTNCQRELLSLLSPSDSELPPREDEMSMPYVGSELYGAFDAPFLSSQPSDNDFATRDFSPEVVDTGAKRVIDITTEQARELIANVSERSQDALKLFAVGQAVLLERLVGPNVQYRDFNDLKRSLVGAVNRRLRTVTENRSAVLFSSDRDKTRIRVTPLSAASLRQALNVQEPLPNFDYVDQDGLVIADSSELALEFQKQVKSAWTDMSFRPLEGQGGLVIAQIYEHLLGHGFTFAIGKPLLEAGADHPLRYELTLFDGDEVGLLSQMDLNGMISVPESESSARVRAFLRHTAQPNVFGALLN